jgi:hypothetical protein
MLVDSRPADLFSTSREVERDAKEDEPAAPEMADARRLFDIKVLAS